jgi:hypothetical protein
MGDFFPSEFNFPFKGMKRYASKMERFAVRETNENAGNNS